MSLTIWCNAQFNAAATRLLAEGVAGHRLVTSAGTSANVLQAGAADPALATASRDGRAANGNGGLNHPAPTFSGIGIARP